MKRLIILSLLYILTFASLPSNNVGSGSSIANPDISGDILADTLTAVVNLDPRRFYNYKQCSLKVNNLKNSYVSVIIFFYF